MNLTWNFGRHVWWKLVLFNWWKNGDDGSDLVFKGWIDEQTLSPSTPETGTAVSFKNLKPEGFQGDKEYWLVMFCYLSIFVHLSLTLPSWSISIPYSTYAYLMQSELNYIGQLHHPNLVKLFGYCLDGQDWFLVYEFLKPLLVC